MNTYIKLENVAEGLNNNLDSGLKAETEQARKGNSIPWKLSLGGAFQTNSSLKLSGNECFPPDYLLARFLSILLSELYWQDIGDWQPGLCFPQASLSFPVAVYVAGSGMLNPIRDFFFSLMHIQHMGTMPIFDVEKFLVSPLFMSIKFLVQ